MSTITVTTRITYKYLMNKSKSDLCSMIEFITNNYGEYVKLMGLTKRELCDMIMKLTDEQDEVWKQIGE
jgi:hypothetical protein